MSCVAERRTTASETSIDSPCESDEYDSDSSLWGGSDDEWHEVSKDAFMSDAMARVLALSRHNSSWSELAREEQLGIR